jgi:hypothetical protein
VSNRKNRVLAGVVVAAAAGAALIGTASAANAASVAPQGLVSVESCTSATGSTTYQPGLTTVTRNQTAQLSATLGGCSNAFNGASPGTGALNANLTALHGQLMMISVRSTACQVTTLGPRRRLRTHGRRGCRSIIQRFTRRR